MISTTMPVTEAYIILNDLNTQGKLKNAVKSGVESGRHEKFFQIYQLYITETSRFTTKSRKVNNVMHRMQSLYKRNVCRNEVLRAIEMMES